MKGWKPWIEVPAFLAAALACAGISNHLAGPTRRLAWKVEKPALVPPPATAPVPVATVPPTPGPRPSPAKPKPAKAASVVPAWDPADLLARFPPLSGQAFAEVSSDDARWLQLHGALTLDVRRTAMFAEGHLPGAKSLPVWEDGLAPKIAALKGDPLLPTLVYCAGGDCQDSHLLAQKLWLAGYRNLRIYTGGYPDWVGRGWPVAKGETP
ncbi:MAG: rhodanese-like domain-containing protein [Acidobacteria bacterium]|nr:rhodanese-like domain-containing protein [Acidobacteriota bacterium]